MDLAYVAHSERCALLLDSEGVCRWVVPKIDSHDPIIASAQRCVGAQFVATLDRTAEGFLGSEPRIGACLLFASVTDGRIALVRFGPLVAFETLDESAGAPGVDTVRTLPPAHLLGSGVLDAAHDALGPPRVPRIEMPSIEEDESELESSEAFARVSASELEMVGDPGATELRSDAASSLAVPESSEEGEEIALVTRATPAASEPGDPAESVRDDGDKLEATDECNVVEEVTPRRSSGFVPRPAHDASPGSQVFDQVTRQFNREIADLVREEEDAPATTRVLLEPGPLPKRSAR